MIKIARDVNKAVEEVNTMPMLGFINDIVDVETADPDPIKISLINNRIFLLFNDLYLFLYYSISILSDFKMFSRSCFFV